MGMTFENLTWDDLCDLMCGGPEEEEECQYTEQSPVAINGVSQERPIMAKELREKQQSRVGR